MYESESDSEHEEQNEIFEEDEEFLDSEKVSSQYYIGICKLIRPDMNYVLLSCVSNRVFLKHSYKSVVNHLELSSIVSVYRPSLDIMKLEILADGTYSVVKKTHWLRVIQRAWRNVLKKRNSIRRLRGGIMSLRYFEIHGRHAPGLRNLPSLYGMLRQITYQTSANTKTD
jgi:hypothetical protein